MGRESLRLAFSVRACVFCRTDVALFAATLYGICLQGQKARGRGAQQTLTRPLTQSMCNHRAGLLDLSYRCKFRNADFLWRLSDRFARLNPFSLEHRQNENDPTTLTVHGHPSRLHGDWPFSLAPRPKSESHRNYEFLWLSSDCKPLVTGGCLNV